MPRKLALHTRYNDDRFVETTSFHSSGFMRMSRLSRVMPALLTTISGAAVKLANNASTDASLLTSRMAPRPAGDRAPSQLEMAAAPCSLVAVPTTMAPCCANVSAIARPMPRDAPVTRAVRPAMPGNFGSDDRSIATSPESTRRGIILAYAADERCTPPFRPTSRPLRHKDGRRRRPARRPTRR